MRINDPDLTPNQKVYQYTGSPATGFGRVGRVIRKKKLRVLGEIIYEVKFDDGVHEFSRDCLKAVEDEK